MYDPFLTAAVFLIICTVVIFPAYLNFRRRYQLTAVPMQSDPVLPGKHLRLVKGRESFEPSHIPTELLPVQDVDDISDVVAWSDITDDNVVEWIIEAESVLLSEAEFVMGEVQDVLNHIASNPPNPEEVTSKIGAIVSAYTILENTEYYEQVNQYISTAVKRDTGLVLTKADIHALWAA